MSRSPAQFDTIYRGVIVYKRTENNPEHVAPKYFPERIPGNGKPAFLYFDEPGYVKYVGPYSRVGDVNAAFGRDGAYEGYGDSRKLRDDIFQVRIEVSVNNWEEHTPGKK